jgi:dienelactone hydrolase
VQRLRSFIAGTSPAQRGALAAVMLVVATLVALTARHSSMGLGTAGDMLVGLAVLALLTVVLGGMTHAAVWLIRRIPVAPIAGLTALTLAGVALVATLLPTPITGTYVLAILAVAAWIGASIGALLGLRGGAATRLRRVLVLGNACALALALGSGATWLLTGDAAVGTVGAERSGGGALTGTDPSLPGEFAVVRFTYGSGTDARRSEYRDQVALRSPMVDLSRLVRNFNGWRADLHQAYWGFRLSGAPLNGTVWAPDAPATAGPFPLVVIVHGNRHTGGSAEAGFGYLGELLASRGNVVVGIDANFLNGPWLAAERQEMPARAWLVLRHLRQLQRWSERPGTPFSGRLDLDRVVLVGHSRGGETAMVAAALNGLERFPDDASVPLDFDFGIRGVIALAPTDQLHRMAGRPVTLSGVSYLVLHGSQDGDVNAFIGTGQYQRVSLEPGTDQFKAAVYIHGANHSRFNALWDSGDSRFPLEWMLTSEPLLAPDVQRRIAAVYAAAFVADVLHGDDRHRAIFRDARQAGAWLPQTQYVTRYHDGFTRLVATFEEDADPTTTTVPGGRTVGEGLLLWREMALYLRDRRATSQQNTAVGLAWRRNGADAPAVYEITMPDSVAATWTQGGRASLVMSIANATPSGETVDMTVEVVSANGATVRLPLSSMGELTRRLHLPVWKPRVIDRYMIRGPEQTLQSYSIPLAELALRNPHFDPRNVRFVRLRFDLSPTGAILLDDVGFEIR